MRAASRGSFVLASLHPPRGEVRSLSDQLTASGKAAYIPSYDPRKALVEQEQVSPDVVMALHNAQQTPGETLAHIVKTASLGPLAREFARERKRRRSAFGRSNRHGHSALAQGARAEKATRAIPAGIAGIALLIALRLDDTQRRP